MRIIPAPILEAFNARDEEGLEQLLDLLFACHYWVDYPECEDWGNSDIAWPMHRRYNEGSVHTRVLAVAPDWSAAQTISKEWYLEWPHTCADADYWLYRYEEIATPKSISFVESMISAVP